MYRDRPAGQAQPVEYLPPRPGHPVGGTAPVEPASSLRLAQQDDRGQPAEQQGEQPAPGGDTEIEIVGTADGGGVVGLGFGLNDSTGSGVAFGLGSGSNGTQPTPVNSTSGQASASRPRTVETPGRAWKPTITRLGRPSIRARTAKLAANCSEVPFWPPSACGEKRKKFRFGYAWPLGASLT